MPSRLLVTVALASLGVVAGCAHSQSPVLYPNAKLQQVGKEQADRDVGACRQMADEYVSNPMAKDAAKGGAIGGVGGAAVGAVAGAVTGHGAGRGTAGGAAAGATPGGAPRAPAGVGAAPACHGLLHPLPRPRRRQGL